MKVIYDTYARSIKVHIRNVTSNFSLSFRFFASLLQRVVGARRTVASRPGLECGVQQAGQIFQRQLLVGACI